MTQFILGLLFLVLGVILTTFGGFLTKDGWDKWQKKDSKLSLKSQTTEIKIDNHQQNTYQATILENSLIKGQNVYLNTSSSNHPDLNVNYKNKEYDKIKLLTSKKFIFSANLEQGLRDLSSDLHEIIETLSDYYQLPKTPDYTMDFPILSELIQREVIRKEILPLYIDFTNQYSKIFFNKSNKESSPNFSELDAAVLLGIKIRYMFSQFKKIEE